MVIAVPHKGQFILLANKPFLLKPIYLLYRQSSQNRKQVKYTNILIACWIFFPSSTKHNLIIIKKFIKKLLLTFNIEALILEMYANMFPVPYKVGSVYYS